MNPYVSDNTASETLCISDNLYLTHRIVQPYPAIWGRILQGIKRTNGSVDKAHAYDFRRTVNQGISRNVIPCITGYNFMRRLAESDENPLQTTRAKLTLSTNDKVSKS